MTIVPFGKPGLDDVTAVLRRGDAVGLPMPSPLPYAVVAADAETVNVTKGRSPGRPVGMAVADLGLVAPFVDLDEETLAHAAHLSGVELFNVMLPVREHFPGWAAGSVARGFLAITLAWHARLRPLLDEAGHLFVSSANRTGGTTTVTAAALDAEFGGQLLVLDGDCLRNQAVHSGSATILRLHRRLGVEVVRRGIQQEPPPTR